MRILQMVLGPVQTNCFILLDDTGKALVVDPADNGERIVEILNENHAQLDKILLTHGHFDHIGGAYYLQTHTDAVTYIHELDNELLADPDKNLSNTFQMVKSEKYYKVKADVLVKEGDTIEFGGLTFTVLHTPGHSRGSCLYVADGLIFAGDTIFKGEIGRNDTYGGSWESQQESLKKINQLEGDYTICPGHGENTTLAYEKEHNPYLRMVR